MEYKHWQEKTIGNPEDVETVEAMYDKGFVFTRLGRGVMHQTESLRVNLEQFRESSENKRVLRKNLDVKMTPAKLPFKNYSWQIGKLAKDFYDKFGEKIMSANKIKEMFTDDSKSNMNYVLTYFFQGKSVMDPIGHCLCYMSDKIIHYSYPFYDSSLERSNLGMFMMLKAILWAQGNAKEFIYLGSDQKYKRQFKGLEVFDGSKWLKQ